MKKKTVAKKSRVHSAGKQLSPKDHFERLHALSKTPKHKLKVSKISTSELEKMHAFGILPFELRKELYKRLGKQ